MYGPVELNSSDEVLDPAHMRIERLKAAERDPYSVANPGKLNEFDLRSPGCQIVSLHGKCKLPW